MVKNKKRRVDIDLNDSEEDDNIFHLSQEVKQAFSQRSMNEPMDKPIIIMSMKAKRIRYSNEDDEDDSRGKRRTKSLDFTDI
ncbi:hypothetical protein Glove_71g79 [Diversispora epigaea]|uniref:Uncharacterized protein n=1 Tax=Diversispora epigaea TaxID=1348612 RepID=A0A397JC04_9GLOM|nr:hypothetical protein Glove_71g79 [Diversispora epigaea]